MYRSASREGCHSESRHATGSRRIAGPVKIDRAARHLTANLCCRRILVLRGLTWLTAPTKQNTAAPRRAQAHIGAARRKQRKRATAAGGINLAESSNRKPRHSHHGDTLRTIVSYTFPPLNPGSDRQYYYCMSTAEIISALPSLTEAQRREVQARLLELALQDEEVKQSDAAAIEGARLLDQMEDEDGRRPQG
jgi:hypothetical protein